MARWRAVLAEMVSGDSEGPGGGGGTRRHDQQFSIGDPLILAALSLGAAVIHLTAAPGHYLELGGLGAGFLIAAAFQGLWARVALSNRSKSMAWLGIAGNLAIILAWAWTRTVGLPVGPDAGTPELVGLPDGAATLFELLIVIGLAARIGGVEAEILRRLSTARRSLLIAALVPALGLILVTTTFATLEIAAGHEHRDSAESATSRPHVPQMSQSHHP